MRGDVCGIGERQSALPPQTPPRPKIAMAQIATLRLTVMLLPNVPLEALEFKADSLVQFAFLQNSLADADMNLSPLGSHSR